MFVEGGIKTNLKDFQPIHDRCVTDVEGINKCDKVYNDKELGYLRCLAYVNPSYWWDHVGTCPLASHVHELSEREKVKRNQTQKMRVGQQKHAR